MAQRTLTLNATRWAYVSIGYPDQHFTISDSTPYSVGDEAKLLIGFESVPTALKRNRILGMHFTVQGITGYYTSYPTLHYLESDFNENTVTYNTAPKWNAYGIGTQGSPGVYDQWQNYSRNETVYGLPTSSTLDNLQKMIQNGTFAVGGYGANVQVKTKATGGSAALVSVDYDPDVIVQSQVVMTDWPIGTVDPRKVLTFKWKVAKQAGYYCADEVFAQTSAKLYWKLSTDENWTVINITGTGNTATIAANTIPTASTVEFYVEATDEEGTTSETQVYTFQTPVNNIYFSEKPLGDNIDIREPILFQWSLSSNIGEYDQASATLYWKREEDDTWNEISTTTQKSITVPALTFPTYATIVWYLEATDTGGHTATYAETRFTTPTVTIKAILYPDGNDINTQQAQFFSWAYSNNRYTDYTQSSATFYWRQRYAENWNTVALTGNVKYLNVAANTFPTNKTIEWFVEGTDCGGTTSNTGKKAFNTVTTQIVPQNCPTGGYQDPRYDITFSWYYSNVYGDYTQSSAVLYWREVGEEEYTEISVSGNAKTVTVAQNTFPVASEIEWYIAGTDSGGTTTQTGKFTFSTTATTAYAVCIAPVGQVEDGTKPITFSWIVKNDDGSLPVRTVVEWKYDTESQLQWKPLLDTVNTDTEYTVAGGTFHAGAVEWRVSAYNRDIVQGPYNNASFVCLMSPDAPVGLAATPVPRTTIRWQAPGQEGFEITIDGKVITQQYAPGVYSYQVNEPLEDGEHIIKVRVQGQYGLWSNWSETSIKVENDPGNTVTLSGVFDIDAQLLWALGTDDPDAKSHVYRDGVRIAAVGNELSFTDKMAIGEHSYYVELWDDDGNYSRSNTVTGVMTVDTMVISEIGGEWMELKLSETSDRNENFQWSRNYAMKTVCGAEYPVVEIGTHSTMSGSFACAFDNLAEAAQFERLKGKIVVLKSGKLNMMVGAMVRLNKKVTQFYVSYNFTLDQIDWEDFYEPGT